ncbi:peptidoglycan DD-metalloendopeptidase family protein [Polaribacter sp.]|uniref:peptidoglycan DD-metalloendopeptidase family protein n=1 Tax=Polaribacter sp. TaxID=1920175 RepID=UPI004048D2AF
MKQNEYITAFKNKYGFLKHSNETLFNNWAKNNTFSLKELFPTIQKNEIFPLDVSINSTWIGGEEEFNNLLFFEKKLKKLQAENPTKIIAGGYLEKRALYTSEMYVRKINDTFDRRNTHLGVDFWLPKNTPIYAMFDGEVIFSANDNEHKGYGGLIILKHEVENFHFFTLYGHLSKKSVSEKISGDFIKKGSQIAVLGDASENGDWVPHLHFQIMLSLLDYQNDFPGVAFENELEVWKNICPNPNLLFKLTNL